MSSLFKWHNRFSENENENEAMDARIPRHLDSKTKKPRHRNSRTKNPRHRERETTKPQHCDSKAFFQRRKSHNIEIPRLKNHDIGIPRPKNHDIKFLWNSDPYPPDSNRRVKYVPSGRLKGFCAYFVKFEQRNFFSFFQDYGFGGSDDDDQQLNLHYSTLHAENEDLPEVVLLSQNVELIANSNIESMSHIAENINFPCRLGEPEVAVKENENNNEGYNDDEALNSNTTQCRGYLIMFLLAFLIVVLYLSLGFDNQEYHINSFRRHFY